MGINKLIQLSSATGLVLLAIYLFLAWLSAEHLLLLASIIWFVATLVFLCLLFLMPSLKSKLIWICGTLLFLCFLTIIGGAFGAKFLVLLGFSGELMTCSRTFILYPFIGFAVMVTSLWLVSVYFMVEFEPTVKARFITSCKILTAFAIVGAFLAFGHWIIDLGFIH